MTSFEIINTEGGTNRKQRVLSIYFHVFESKSKTLIFFTSKNISRDNREFISNDIESKTSSHFPP